MKKMFIPLFVVLFSAIIYANEGDFGIVYDEDFKAVGVSETNLKNAKILMEKTGLQVKKLSLDKRQLELEANRLLLEGAEKNLKELEAIMDKLGELEATRLKNQIRSQIEMYRFISRQQYIQAREKAIERLKKEQKSIDSEDTIFKTPTPAKP